MHFTFTREDKNVITFVNARTAHPKLNYPTLENLPEISINEAITLLSIDDSSFKLIGNGKSYNQ